jgi:hypothetical protein
VQNEIKTRITERSLKKAKNKTKELKIDSKKEEIDAINNFIQVKLKRK